MPEFKKALIKAEQERIKDMQKKEAEKKIQADQQYAHFKFSNKYNDKIAKLNEKSVKFRKLQGYETPMVLYMDMFEMLHDWIEVWQMAAPGLLVDLIKLIPITIKGVPLGDGLLELGKMPFKAAKIKFEMMRKNGLFNDPKVVLPVISHTVELDANNKFKMDCLESFSTGGLKADFKAGGKYEELQKDFNVAVFNWLAKNGYHQASPQADGRFYSNLDNTVLTQAAFKTLRDDPVDGLNEYFQKGYDIQLSKSPSP